MIDINNPVIKKIVAEWYKEVSLLIIENDNGVKIVEKNNCMRVTLPNKLLGVILCNTDINKTLITPIKIPEASSKLLTTKRFVVCSVTIQIQPKQIEKNNNKDNVSCFFLKKIEPKEPMKEPKP